MIVILRRARTTIWRYSNVKIPSTHERRLGRHDSDQKSSSTSYSLGKDESPSAFISAQHGPIGINDQRELNVHRRHAAPVLPSTGRIRTRPAPNRSAASYLLKVNPLDSIGERQPGRPSTKPRSETHRHHQVHEPDARGREPATNPASHDQHPTRPGCGIRRPARPFRSG